RAALQPEPQRRAGVATPVVSDVAGAQVHFALVGDVGAEAHRFPAERTRIDVARGRAQLRVFHVVVDEFQSIEYAELDLRRKRISLVGLARVESAAEISYRNAERERRTHLCLVLGAKVYRARAFYLGTHAAALPRAVNAQLYDFVVDSSS